MSKGQRDAPSLPEGSWAEVVAPDLVLLGVPVPDAEIPPLLSPAEQQIVLLVYEGASNEDMAQARGVSVKTISNQLEAIFRKLSISSRAELVLLLRGKRR